MQMSRALTVLALVIGFAGCGAPGSVEGVFSSASFRLDCAQPLAKLTASDRDMIVVMADSDSETLRAVNITLPNAGGLPVGSVIEMGTGASDDVRPAVRAIVGDLVVDVRGDGAEVLSSTNAATASSTGGSLTIEARDDESVVGTFAVDLDDGGYLQGSFAAVLTR